MEASQPLRIDFWEPNPMNSVPNKLESRHKRFPVEHPITSRTLGYAGLTSEAETIARHSLSDPQWIEYVVLNYGPAGPHWSIVCTARWHDKHEPFVTLAESAVPA